MRRVSRNKQRKFETNSDVEEELGGFLKNDNNENESGNDVEVTNLMGKKRNARNQTKTSEEKYEEAKEEIDQENNKLLSKKRKKDNDYGNVNDKNQFEEEIEKTKGNKKKRGKQDTDLESYEDQTIIEENEKSIKDKKNKISEKVIQNELDAEEYEVEKIVDQRTIKGRRQFLVRWKGYTDESDTWEQEKELNCDRLIEEFLVEQEENNESFENNVRKKIEKTKTKKQHKKFKVQKKSNKIKNDMLTQASNSSKNEDNGEDSDNSKEYEVDKIIEVHFKKNKTREFLIRWKGFSSNEDTWEPEEHLHCPELINKFMEKLEKIKNIEIRELRANPSHTKRYTLTMYGDKRQSRRNVDKQRVTYHECDE